MSNLRYTRMLTEDDADITRLIKIYQMPEISQYISISDNYFHYVTTTANVYFYKVYENNKMVGSIHLEKNENLLYMDILVFPEFQRMGFGTKIIKDIQDDIFELEYEKIEISIDESNVASIQLFSNAGFVFMSKEDELINLIYLTESGSIKRQRNH